LVGVILKGISAILHNSAHENVQVLALKNEEVDSKSLFLELVPHLLYNGCLLTINITDSTLIFKFTLRT
jgi:hypothetical protein